MKAKSECRLLDAARTLNEPGEGVTQEQAGAVYSAIRETLPAEMQEWLDQAERGRLAEMLLQAGMKAEDYRSLQLARHANRIAGLARDTNYLTENHAGHLAEIRLQLAGLAGRLAREHEIAGPADSPARV